MDNDDKMCVCFVQTLTMDSIRNIWWNCKLNDVKLHCVFQFEMQLYCWQWHERNNKQHSNEIYN